MRRFFISVIAGALSMLTSDIWVIPGERSRKYACAQRRW